MDVKDLLKVIQVQRHDFLNHLQVVSGLVQLGKTDRVKGYIERICRDLQLMSNISRIKVPEVVAAIMIGNNLAAEQQIDIDYYFETDLGDVGVPGEILGWTLVEIQKNLFKSFLPQADSRQVNFIIEQFRENYICRINTKNSSLSNKESLEELLQVVDKKLGLDNGLVEITNSKERFDIAIIFPAEKYVEKYINECIG